MLIDDISKKILDASFQYIIKQLEYSSAKKGKYFYQVDKFYKSSQICSCCNNVDKQYSNINKRLYICHNCGNEIERDLNASINIMFEGINKHLTQYDRSYRNLGL